LEETFSGATIVSAHDDVPAKSLSGLG